MFIKKNFLKYLRGLNGNGFVDKGIEAGENLNTNKWLSKKFRFNFNQESNNPKISSFRIEITDITSRVGFSYSNDGWHPFVETLKEYQRNPKLLFNESALSKLYNNYQPKNLQEVLLDHLEDEIKPISELPPINDILRNLWCLKKDNLDALKMIQKKRKPEGWILFGPHSDDYGEREFFRLLSVYNSIKKNGYNPDISQKDMINGYFLKKGEKSVFVLLQGNHRVSALKVLGYNFVDVVLRSNHPAVIDHQQLQNWTFENEGIFPYNGVIELFENLFNEKGLNKAVKHNLIVH